MPQRKISKLAFFEIWDLAWSLSYIELLQLKTAYNIIIAILKCEKITDILFRCIIIVLSLGAIRIIYKDFYIFMLIISTPAILFPWDLKLLSNKLSYR